MLKWYENQIKKYPNFLNKHKLDLFSWFIYGFITLLIPTTFLYYEDKVVVSSLESIILLVLAGIIIASIRLTVLCLPNKITLKENEIKFEYHLANDKEFLYEEIDFFTIFHDSSQKQEVLEICLNDQEKHSILISNHISVDEVKNFLIQKHVKFKG